VLYSSFAILFLQYIYSKSSIVTQIRRRKRVKLYLNTGKYLDF